MQQKVRYSSPINDPFKLHLPQLGKDRRNLTQYILNINTIGLFHATYRQGQTRSELENLSGECYSLHPTQMVKRTSSSIAAQLLLQTRTTVFERRIFLSLKPAPASSPTKSEKVKVTTLIFLRQQSQHFGDRDFGLTVTLSHTQQTITQYKHFVLCYLCLGSNFMICPSSLCNGNF